MKQKYLGQRINEWWLGVSIFFWIFFLIFVTLGNSYVHNKLEFVLFSFAFLSSAIRFTKLSFEDVYEGERR